MDSLSAFARGEANRGKRLMVFDWNKAARRIKKNKPNSASAGLREDWEYTGGEIWDGAPIPEDETYVYLASTWAVPELEMDGVIEECFIMEDKIPKGWDKNDPAKIYWPESALKIIGGQK